MAQLKDTIIQGSAKITDTLYSEKIQITKINIPTSAGGTTYGPGTAGYALLSNGDNGVYWGNVAITETDPTVPAWAKASSKPSYTASEVGAMATTHAANGITATDISNWNAKTSNVGTVTSVRVQATSPVLSSSSAAQTGLLNTTISLADNYGDSKNPYAAKTAHYVLAGPSTGSGSAAPAFRALVADDIPISSWAKASSKPSYTATEVGALPSSTTYVSSFNGQTGAVTFSDTDTKQNVVLGNTTKAYITGTTTATSTAQALTAIADSNVFLDTTAGRLAAKEFRVLGSAGASNLMTSDAADNIFFKMATNKIPFLISSTTIRSGNGVANTIDLGVSTNRWNNVYVKNLNTPKITAPTTAGGSTYGVGTAGQTLVSDGTGVYWGTPQAGASVTFKDWTVS